MTKVTREERKRVEKLQKIEREIDNMQEDLGSLGRLYKSKYR